ncbi:hypothetical protein [Kribbella italica]|uniref:GAF domain-containing protein n=1 Tax=Kribbella italica TaxID=1540520 RepID=A0A7W9MXW2_9ACTN|nr:hypothetical protein [Kribbella italica]MBB5840209.1 hypothetical protein [Kribbella italica]
MPKIERRQETTPALLPAGSQPAGQLARRPWRTLLPSWWFALNGLSAVLTGVGWWTQVRAPGATGNVNALFIHTTLETFLTYCGLAAVVAGALLNVAAQLVQYRTSAAEISSRERELADREARLADREDEIDRQQTELADVMRALEEQILLSKVVLRPLIGTLISLGSLDPMTLPDDQKTLPAQLYGQALVTMQSGIVEYLGGSVSDVRVIYWQVEGRAPHRLLRAIDKRGERKKPSLVMREGDNARGDEAFRALDAKQPRIWHLGEDGAPYAWNKRKVWKAFAALHVSGEEGDVFGMVTIDSPDCEAITEDHVRTAQVIADAFAATCANYARFADYPTA